MIKRLISAAFKCPAFAQTIMGGISAFALAFALTAQYAFNMQPCVLCIYQRIPYAVVIALAIMGILATKAMGPRYGALNVALCGIAFLVNSGIAFYNVGVEQHWWVSGCSTPTFANMSPEEALQAIRNAPLARCDEIAWSLFGISMAGYNVLMCLVLGFYGLIASYTIPKKKTANDDMKAKACCCHKEH